MQQPVYREHAPSPSLADVVQCYWTSRSAAPLVAPHASSVLPDGCMDVIFNLGDPPLPGAQDAALRSYVIGAMRTPLQVRMAGTVDLLGIRFRPGGAAAFVRAPAGELTDRSVALREFWRRTAELEERLYETPPDARIRLVEEVLLGRAAAGPDPRIAHVSRLIERSGGSVPVKALHEAVGLTRRHLERIYLERVGLTPKNACRVARVQAALERIRANPGVPLSRLALECGWYDQSHMNRDFREIAGASPTTHARQVAFFQDARRSGG